jgi:hypothetical protein
MLRLHALADWLSRRLKAPPGDGDGDGDALLPPPASQLLRGGGGGWVGAMDGRLRDLPWWLRAAAKLAELADALESAEALPELLGVAGGAGGGAPDALEGDAGGGGCERWLRRAVCGLVRCEGDDGDDDG